jgi:hypothetical protein
MNKSKSTQTTQPKARIKAAVSPAKPVKPAAAPKTAPKAVKDETASVDDKKAKKAKVVRDSFTMPKQEYAQFAELKARFLTAGIAVKKSELLRAGLVALTNLKINELKAAVQALDSIKTGRPPLAGQKEQTAASKPIRKKEKVKTN